MIGKQELDPNDVTIDDPQQSPHYAGGGGGSAGRDAGGIQAKVASLMDASTCDWAGMLVPCALEDQFAQTIHEAGAVVLLGV